MASQKSKKAGKKDNSQPEPKKELKETKEAIKDTVKKDAKTEETAKAETKENKEAKSTKEATVTEAESVKKTTVVASGKSANPLRGFFARKYNKNENILTIFKSPKIWGALVGEVLGTMLLVMLLLMLGTNPVYFWIAALCIYMAALGLSGANLNPLITAGLMASRRMSAIRGVLYMLAQLLGAWLGLLLVNAFRLGSGTANELPVMDQIKGETFWAVALIELVGAIVIAYCFARAIKYSKKSPLAFGMTVVSGIVLAIIFAMVLSNFFSMQTSFIFNPVAALMYQILPTAGEAGELLQMFGLAAGAYILMPIVGGIIGFYISDLATRLSLGGYSYDYDTDETNAVAKK